MTNAASHVHGTATYLINIQPLVGLNILRDVVNMLRNVRSGPIFVLHSKIYVTLSTLCIKAIFINTVDKKKLFLVHYKKRHHQL